MVALFWSLIATGWPIHCPQPFFRAPPRAAAASGRGWQRRPDSVTGFRDMVAGLFRDHLLMPREECWIRKWYDSVGRSLDTWLGTRQWLKIEWCSTQRKGLLRVGFELSTRRDWAGACQGARAGCAIVPLHYHAPSSVIGLKNFIKPWFSSPFAILTAL